jgi:23S rRNA pseudouridine1911/1915/1917 synthase
VERRSLPVPDGLAGERADAGLGKLLGFSRTFAAEVIEAGGATLDGIPLGKSDRLTAGGWLEVEWMPKTAPAIVPALVPGFEVVFDDDDIVVIDKPVGVAAHPASGWDGPTVLGALAGAGYPI